MPKFTLDFPASVALQQQAENLAISISDSGIFGVKCWYSHANTIEHGSERAFVGVNPAGGKDAEDDEIQRGYLDWPYTQREYNAWVDETWVGNGPKHQSAVHKAFQAMYGRSWETMLRKTACFNLIPFRTPSAKHLSTRAKDVGISWSSKVFERVLPSFIICNGIATWDVVKEMYGVKGTQIYHIGGKANIREGRIASGRLEDSRIIGLPHLSRFGWAATFTRLEAMQPFD